MNQTINRAMIAVGVVAAGWSVAPALFYFGFIAFFWAQRSYAVFPAAVCLAGVLCGLAMFRPSRRLTVVAIPCALVVCAVAIAGVMYDFTAYGEPAPGPWEWIDSTSLTASLVLLAVTFVRAVSFRSHDRELPNPSMHGTGDKL